VIYLGSLPVSDATRIPPAPNDPRGRQESPEHGQRYPTSRLISIIGVSAGVRCWHVPAVALRTVET
jgi:hypothetical protein